jgi:hypothetical protein
MEESLRPLEEDAERKVWLQYLFKAVIGFSVILFFVGFFVFAFGYTAYGWSTVIAWRNVSCDVQSGLVERRPGNDAIARNIFEVTSASIGVYRQAAVTSMLSALYLEQRSSQQLAAEALVYIGRSNVSCFVPQTTISFVQSRSVSGILSVSSCGFFCFVKVVDSDAGSPDLLSRQQCSQLCCVGFHCCNAGDKRGAVAQLCDCGIRVDWLLGVVWPRHLFVVVLLFAPQTDAQTAANARTQRGGQATNNVETAQMNERNFFLFTTQIILFSIFSRRVCFRLVLLDRRDCSLRRRVLLRRRGARKADRDVLLRHDRRDRRDRLSQSMSTNKFKTKNTISKPPPPLYPPPPRSPPPPPPPPVPVDIVTHHQTDFKKCFSRSGGASLANSMRISRPFFFF